MPMKEETEGHGSHQPSVLPFLPTSQLRALQRVSGLHVQGFMPVPI